MFFSLLLLVSCQKRATPACNWAFGNTSDTATIIGEWELSLEHNGLSGSVNYDPCNGNRYVFTENNYARYTKEKLIAQGTYRIFKDSSYFTPVQNRIVFDDDTSGLKTFITNTGAELSFSVDAADGPGATYVRRSWTIY